MKYRMNMCLASLLLLLLCFAHCGQNQISEQESAVSQKMKNPVQEGWNSKITITRLGLRQAVVNYGHMIKYEMNDTIYFDEGVEVDFFDESGNHTSHLISERGRYNEKSEDVIGIGNVRVLSDSGATLNTEILRWDNAEGRIYSDTLVMVTSPDYDTLYGIGFESNADLTRRVIYRPRGKTKRNVNLDAIDKDTSGKRTDVQEQSKSKSSGQS